MLGIESVSMQRGLKGDEAAWQEARYGRSLNAKRIESILPSWERHISIYVSMQRGLKVEKLGDHVPAR